MGRRRLGTARPASAQTDGRADAEAEAEEPLASARGATRAGEIRAAVAVREEQAIRRRWDATQAEVRRRVADSAPARVTRRVAGWFPVRVWRHFLQNNGFLLAAGVSYQALFALSAAIYVVFAAVGIWLGGNLTAVDGLIDLINNYLPGLIGDDGLVSTAEVEGIVDSTTGVFSVTGAVALVIAVWTAIGWVTFSRRAVRDMFGLPPDLRNYVMLKARDLLAAIVFGLLLVIGGGLTAVGTWALSPVTAALGWSTESGIAGSGIRIATLVVSFAVNSTVLAGLFRFLTGTTLRGRRVVPGSLVGGAGLTVLQIAAGLLVSYTPSNPLLATFAIFIGLLLWFRLVGVVMLVAASWVAVSASDDGHPILPASEQAQLEDVHAALLLAAQVRVRTAQDAAADAPWWGRWTARRRLRDARRELAEVEASGPPARRSTVS